MGARSAISNTSAVQTGIPSMAADGTPFQWYVFASEMWTAAKSARQQCTLNCNCAASGARIENKNRVEAEWQIEKSIKKPPAISSNLCSESLAPISFRFFFFAQDVSTWIKAIRKVLKQKISLKNIHRNK